MAFGGHVDEPEDRALIREGLHAHERARHPGEKLTAFASGGWADDDDYGDAGPGVGFMEDPEESGWRGLFNAMRGRHRPLRMYAEGGDTDDEYSYGSGANRVTQADLDKAAGDSLARSDLADQFWSDPRGAFGVPRYGETTRDPALGRTAAFALSALPGVGLLAHLPWAQKRLSNPDFYRTVAQGVAPVSDEVEAGVRSAFGPKSYSEALQDAREGRQRYRQEMGGTEADITEGLGTAGSLLLGGGIGAGVKGLTLAPRLASLAARYPRLASILPMSGAGAARGYAEGEGEEDRMARALEGAVTGGAFGAGTYGAKKAAQWAWPRLKSAFGYGPSIVRDPRFLEPHELPPMTAFGG